MKKIAAFFTAFILFIICTIIVHFAVSGTLSSTGKGFGTWTNPYKDLAYTAISKNIDDDTCLMLGSSEFQYGRKTPYHPTNMFRQLDMNAMCIGAAYNQSLSHAITLGSIGNNLKNKKVFLILSPAWFDKEGVKNVAFAVRFSETEYVEMLKNPNLSDELKRDIAQRCRTLLEEDPSLGGNVKRYTKLYVDENAGFFERRYSRFRIGFLREKEAINVSTLWKFSGKKKYEEFMHKKKGKNNKAYTPRDEKKLSLTKTDWDYMKDLAYEDYLKTPHDNQFHMLNRNYNKKIKPVLKKQKGAMVDRKFTTSSPEYGDLDLFLRVCDELGIESKIVLLPINGYWYDYTGFSRDARKVLPGQIKSVIDRHNGVHFVSFYDKGYDKGFLADVFHPTGLGWVDINQEAYDFFNEKNKTGVNENEEDIF